MDDAAKEAVCPIDYALSIFGDRWTLLIVRDLLLSGKRYYSELLAAKEGISTNILAARLKRLEAAGLLERFPDPDSGRQVIYCLTEKGIDLVPVLLEIGLWSYKHDPTTAFPLSDLRRSRNDREGLVSDLKRAARKRANHDRRRAQLVAPVPVTAEPSRRRRKLGAKVGGKSQH